MRQQLERTREKLIRSKNCLASTVCYQCCCSSYDWSAQIRPRHAVAEGLALATCTWTHNLQAVRSCSQRSPRYGAARYLQDVIQPVAATSRRRLRSTSSSALLVPVTRRTTIGDRAFAVAGPRAWNSLLSSSSTARLLAPSENISRPICFHCYSRAQNSKLLR